MSWWRRIGWTTSRVSPASWSTGSVQTSWCCTASSGTGTPAIAPTVGPQIPAQMSTRSHSIRPASVSTPCTHPRWTSKPVTVTPPAKLTPLAAAARASAATIGTAMAMPSLGTRYAPRIAPGSSSGTRSAAWAGVSSSPPSIPYDRDHPSRRFSSRIRAGVVAISREPTPYQHGSPSNRSPWYSATVSCAMRQVVREPLVWNTSPGACEVEPPVSNSGPWSSTSTSDWPSSASCQAALAPTMPQPTITVWARSSICLPLWCQVDHDRLQLGEALHREASAHPPDTAARPGPAAERQVRLPVVGALVDVHPTSPYRLGERQPAPQVTGEDRRQQPVLRAVHQLDRLALVADGGDRRDRAEGLLAGDLHLVAHPVQHGRLEEQVAAVLGGALAAGDQRRAPLQRVADVPLGLGGGGLVVEGSHGGGVVEGVAEADPLGDRGGQARQVVVLDLVLDEDPLAGRAALPGVQEARLQGGVDRPVEVGVLHDHQRAVAAHLQQQLLAGGAPRHLVAGGDRADEPDRLGARVGGQLVADDRAVPGDQVDHPW